VTLICRTQCVGRQLRDQGQTIQSGRIVNLPGKVIAAGTAPRWAPPKYPGDAVRHQMLRRGEELGSVQIMDYGKGAQRARYRIASFCPGCIVHTDGDTPKTEPDAEQWCTAPEYADECFERLVRLRKRGGWKEWRPR
jgi:hypothetical protein